VTVDHTDRAAAPGPAPPPPPDTPDTPGAPDTPAAPLTTEARQAAFAAGTPHMSRRVIAWGIAVLLVLGVGGALADHLVTSSTPPPANADHAPTGHSGSVVPNHRATTTTASQLHAPLTAFMGLNTLKDATAANFTLTDAATGKAVSLGGLAGHVVVLTFANAPCNDICTVLSQELAKADAMLGTTSVPVTFVTVNTDPLATAPGDAAVLSRSPLGHLQNFTFLTGSIKALNAVWVSYGISITADRSTGVVTHNELMYFIGPTGKIAWAATPVANETSARTYSLPASEINRFARGIAYYARKLAHTP
jgi:cytochrome oxidase Cu insertion factor (SCO1/SenC/PrrC family)